MPGYTGRLCENEIDYCETANCKNGATCRSSVKLLDYDCECVPGYEGRECQTEIQECKSSPCQNGATCKEGINKYTCNCTDGTYIDTNFVNYGLYKMFIGFGLYLNPQQQFVSVLYDTTKAFGFKGIWYF